MSKHVPGPWSVGLHREIAASDGFVVVDSPRSGSWGFEVANANAHLIAAAPEMLEALKAAHRRAAHREGDCYSNDYMGACCCGKDVMAAVIAKAEGRKS